MITRDQAVEQVGKLEVAVPALEGIVKGYDFPSDTVTIALNGGSEITVPRWAVFDVKGDES